MEEAIDRQTLWALEAASIALRKSNVNPCDMVPIPCNLPINARTKVPYGDSVYLSTIFGVSQKLMPFLGVLKLCDGYKPGTPANLRDIDSIRLPTDQAGHLIGQALGGWGDYASGNIVPMDATLNNSGYKRMENYARRQVGPGCPVCVITIAYYMPPATHPITGGLTWYRPSSFHYFVFSKSGARYEELPNGGAG